MNDDFFVSPCRNLEMVDILFWQHAAFILIVVWLDITKSPKIMIALPWHEGMINIGHWVVRWCNQWLATSPRVQFRSWVRSRWVKPKTMKVAFTSSLLNAYIRKELRSKSDWLGIMIVCSDESTCLHVDSCFDKPTTQRACLVQYYIMIIIIITGNTRLITLRYSPLTANRLAILSTK